MFEDIKKVLLITDMDGTFLPSSKIPSETDILAVKRLMDAGGKFSIATGRSLQATMQYLDRVTINCAAILCNGGMVYDINAKKQIYDVYLPESAKEITKRILKDNPMTGCEVLPLSAVYVPNMTATERAHCNICKVDPIECDIDNIPDNWYKTLFADEPNKIPALIEYIERLKTETDCSDIDFVISAPTYYEMLPKNISKGSALKKMRELCGLDEYTIVAMGDYNNDIEMLKYADVGICPSNAVEEAKAAADVVLDVSCEENAAAAAVEYIFAEVNRRG